MKTIKHNQLKLIEANDIFTKVVHYANENSNEKEPRPSSKKKIITVSELNIETEDNNNSFYESFLQKIHNGNANGNGNTARFNASKEGNNNNNINKESPSKKQRVQSKIQSKTKKEKKLKNLGNFVVQTEKNIQSSINLSPLKGKGKKVNGTRKNALDIQKILNKFVMEDNIMIHKRKTTAQLGSRKFGDKIEEGHNSNDNNPNNPNNDNEHTDQVLNANINEDNNKADALNHNNDKDNIITTPINREKESKTPINNIDEVKATILNKGIKPQLVQCEKEENNIIENNKNTITNTNTEINNNKIFNTNIHIHHISPFKKLSSSLEKDISKKKSKKTNQTPMADSISLNQSNKKVSALNIIGDFHNNGNKPPSILKNKQVKRFWCLFCIPTGSV